MSEKSSKTIDEVLDAAEAKGLDTVDNIPQDEPEVLEEKEVTEPELQPGEIRYTPNYKYKIHDNEFEVDELVKPLMTNEENEKKINQKDLNWKTL